MVPNVQASAKDGRTNLTTRLTTHVVKNGSFRSRGSLLDVAVFPTGLNQGQALFQNALERHGLRGPDILLSHGNGFDAEEAKS